MGSKGKIYLIEDDMAVRDALVIFRKRLANYIYPALGAAAMMIPSSIDMPRVHHEFELI